MNEDVYKYLVKRATKMLKKYNNNTIDPEGLVAETFIRFGELREDDFAWKMYELAGLTKFNTYKKNENKIHDHRTCRMCNETKESGWFRYWYLRGYLIYDSYCKQCKNKMCSESKKIKRESLRAGIADVLKVRSI